MLESQSESFQSTESLIQALDWLKRLSAKKNPFAKEEALDLHLCRTALLNPVRGYLDSNLLKTNFHDLTSIKCKLVGHLAEKLRKQYDDDLFQLLFDVAVSTEPGLDISYYALQLLSFGLISEQKAQSLRDMLKKPISRESCITAHLILRGRHNQTLDTDEEHRAYYLSRKFKYFSPKALIDMIETRHHYHASELSPHTSWAKIEAYRQWRAKAQNPTDQDNDEIWNEITQSMRIKNRQLKRSLGDFEGSLPTLGVEIQGILPSSIPKAFPTDGQYTRFSPIDYQEISDLGGFIKSKDRYYEFALPPTWTPFEQSLIIQTLFKMGLIQAKDTSFHITLGGLKTSEKYREPAAIQIMMLACDRLRLPSELTPLKASTSWDVFAGKRALRSRTAEEVIAVRSPYHLDYLRPQYAAELRITALDSPLKIYKDLLVIKGLGKLALENQSFFDNKTYRPAFKNIWDKLIDSVNNLFSTYKLPSVLSVWTYQDLERLNLILTDDKNHQFCNQMRSYVDEAVTNARGNKDQSVALEDETISEEEEKTSVMERILTKYEESMVGFQRRIDEEISPLITRLRRFCLIFSLTSFPAIETTMPGLTPWFVTNALWMLLNPEILKNLPQTVSNLLRAKAPVDYNKFISDLKDFRFSSTLGIAFNTIPFIGDLIARNQISAVSGYDVGSLFLTHLGLPVVLAVASRIGIKLAKPRTPIESYS